LQQERSRYNVAAKGQRQGQGFRSGSRARLQQEMRGTAMEQRNSKKDRVAVAQGCGRARED
jgi:hypothetical protein